MKLIAEVFGRPGSATTAEGYVMRDMRPADLRGSPFGLPCGRRLSPDQTRGGADEHLEAAEDRHRLRRGLPVVLHRQTPDRERAGAGAGRSRGGALADVLP